MARRSQFSAITVGYSWYPQPMRYEAELKRVIRRELNLLGPLTTITISDKGEYAVIQDGDKSYERRLTNLGKELLNKGPAVTWGRARELFLEPE